MARYVLRFFFDNCSGVCLWGGNDETVADFDYPVDLDMLPLSADVIDQGEKIIDRFESLLEAKSVPEESEEFLRDARGFLDLLREQLGTDFLIRDELVIGTF